MPHTSTRVPRTVRGTPTDDWVHAGGSLLSGRSTAHPPRVGARIDARVGLNVWALCALCTSVCPAIARGQSLRGFAITAPPDSAGHADSLAGAKSLAAPARALTPITVALYADGNLRKAVQEGGGGQVSAGSLGASFASPNWSLDLLVNAAGSQDALRRGFGTTVLAPGAGGSLSAGLVEFRRLFNPVRRAKSEDTALPPRRRWGGRAYASASATRWQPDTAQPSVDLSVTGAGAGLFFAIGGTIPTGAAPAAGNTEPQQKPLFLVLDLGPAYRRVGGDALRAQNDQFRQSVGLVGIRRVGLEAGALISFNGLKAGVTYYNFGGDMPGYSRGQVVAGFAVQTTLASGTLSK